MIWLNCSVVIIRRADPEVHMRNAQLPGFGDFDIVPIADGVVSAQVDDCSDSVIFLILRDQGRRRLRRTVKLAWDYCMKIVSQQQNAEVQISPSNPNA